MVSETLNLSKIALGGSCHWCTEALFQSVIGVKKVAQGYVSSTMADGLHSEAVVVYYNPAKIRLKTLIEIHLHTHKSTSDHSMRGKYRSAVYTYSPLQTKEVLTIIQELQPQFKNSIITRVLPFKSFRSSERMFKNYYYSNPEKPFCKKYINPKLQVLLSSFGKLADRDKLEAVMK
jgi:peptide-methionine (S)-S-oxide reductase